MKPQLESLLYHWPKPYIHDTDFIVAFPKKQARFDLISRAFKWKWLKQLRRGFYLIGPPFRKTLPNLYELAQHFYGPSYISLESALSYWGWIPEGVYATTSVCVKRAQAFETDIGSFFFIRTPKELFFQGVIYFDSGYMLATAWKALADYIYVYRKSWESIGALYCDLRIDQNDLYNDLEVLSELIKTYPSKRVRQVLLRLRKEMG